MTVPPALPEMEEDIHHPKLHQKVSKLLSALVLGFSNVNAEVPYHYGILVLEVCQGLLQFR